MPRPNQVAMNAIVSQSGEILIYDDIVSDDIFGGVTAKDFRSLLKDLGNVKDIDVRINSDGGSVFEAVSIYRALADHEAGVTGHVDGIAASSASLILMAADRIKVAEAAFVMVHNPHMIAAGDARHFRERADLLDKVQEQMVNVYSSRTGLEPERVQQLMDDETWMTADEAIQMQFADEITENKAIAAKCDLTRFDKVPEAVVALRDQPERKPDAVDAFHRMVSARRRKLHILTHS